MPGFGGLRGLWAGGTARKVFVAFGVVVIFLAGVLSVKIMDSREFGNRPVGSSNYEVSDDGGDDGEAVVPEQRVFVDPASVDASELYTFMCEVSVKKPEQLIRTCADGGMIVYKIKWDTWSPYGSTGTGIYSENMCDPDCASGNRLETPVRVALDTVIERKGKFYLTNLEVTPVNPDQVPAELNPVGWDVAEFVIEMDW